jgi:osmotically-inducible protein OsmY
MSSPKPLYALASVLILAGILSGCAANRTCGSGDCSDDAKITANIQAELKQHPELEPPSLINVQTMDHVVYLYGKVSMGGQRDAAESIAQDTPGVTRVVNSINVAH